MILLVPMVVLVVLVLPKALVVLVVLVLLPVPVVPAGLAVRSRRTVQALRVFQVALAVPVSQPTPG